MKENAQKLKDFEYCQQYSDNGNLKKRRGEAERILKEIGRKLYTFDENFNIHTQ